MLLPSTQQLVILLRLEAGGAKLSEVCQALKRAGFSGSFAAAGAHLRKLCERDWVEASKTAEPAPLQHWPVKFYTLTAAGREVLKAMRLALAAEGGKRKSKSKHEEERE